jgi:hypothetical protein
VRFKRGEVAGFERGKKPVGPVVCLRISAHG